MIKDGVSGYAALLGKVEHEDDAARVRGVLNCIKRAPTLWKTFQKDALEMGYNINHLTSDDIDDIGKTHYSIIYKCPESFVSMAMTLTTGALYHCGFIPSSDDTLVPVLTYLYRFPWQMDDRELELTIADVENTLASWAETLFGRPLDLAFTDFSVSGHMDEITGDDGCYGIDGVLLNITDTCLDEDAVRKIIKGAPELCSAVNEALQDTFGYGLEDADLDDLDEVADQVVEDHWTWLIAEAAYEHTGIYFDIQEANKGQEYYLVYRKKAPWTMTDDELGVTAQDIRDAMMEYAYPGKLAKPELGFLEDEWY